MFDVAIIGGSNAGLSAALVLGRSMRRVLLLDDGRPCNRFSQASHGFLTRDGVAPAELGQIAREQLRRYTTVEPVQATATAVSGSDGAFTVDTSAGATYRARKLLLATGIRDILPPLPGIESFWGTSVFHCPYCDGWEVRDQPLAVYADSTAAFHQATLIQHWASQLTVFTGGAEVFDAAQAALLAKHGIQVLTTPVAALEGDGGQLTGVRLADGTVHACRAMFVRPGMAQRMTFAQDMGCALTPSGHVQVDVLGRTSVAGVYAAGDIASPMRSVALAVAQGSAAGAGVNHALISEAFV